MVQSRIKQLERLPELQPVEKEPEAVLKFPDIEKLSGLIIFVFLILIAEFILMHGHYIRIAKICTFVQQQTPSRV